MKRKRVGGEQESKNEEYDLVRKRDSKTTR